MVNFFVRLLKIILGRIIRAVNDLYFAMIKHDELQFVEELRKEFQHLPVRELINCKPSERSWLEYINRLRELVVKDNPKEFLRWKLTRHILFASNDAHARLELKQLKRQDDWHKRWREAIRESRVGHPVPFWLYPRTSGNLIHHAYHVAQFERSTGVSIDKIDLVFEFGGGYGSMCRLFHNLGYKEKYLIYDFPELCALQRYYLLSLGLPVYEASNIISARDGVSCISDIDELSTIINNINGRSAMFISTWAISEAPEYLRALILPIITKIDYFLIGYYKKYFEVNNIEFFKQWKIAIGDIQWKEWEHEYLPDHYYLMGNRDTF